MYWVLDIDTFVFSILSVTEEQDSSGDLLGVSLLGKKPRISSENAILCLFPQANYFSYGLGFWRCLNFSLQIPTESTDTVDSASDGPADDGQVQKC